MRSALFLLIVLVAFLPTQSFAITSTSANYDSICRGYTTPSSHSVTTLKNADVQSGALTPSKINTILQHLVMCPSACYDVTLNISIGGTSQADGYMQIDTTASDKCSSPKPKSGDVTSVFSKLGQPNDGRNCNNGKGLPSFSLRITPVSGFIAMVGGDLIPAPFRNARSEGPKTRCDPAVVNTINAFANGNIEQGFQTAASLAQPNQSVPELPDVTKPIDPSQYATMLKSFDPSGSLTTDQINQAVKDHPDDVKLLADCAAGTGSSCSQSDLKQAADNIGLKLNTDISTSISKFKADWEAQQAGSGAPLDDAFKNAGPTLADDTFTKGNDVTDMDRAKCAIANIESGSCSGNYGTIGPSTPSGRAYGKYQVMDFNIPSWTSESCGQSMSPQQFLSDSGCQEQVFEKKFGQLVDKCGSYNGAASAWFSGRCQVSNSNDGYMSVPSYVSKFASVFGSSGPLPFGATSGTYAAGASPFAQVNPIYGNSSNNQVACSGMGYCYLTNWQQAPSNAYPYQVSTGYPVSTGGMVSTGGTVSTGVLPTQTGVVGGTTLPAQPPVPTPAPAVASLIIQPSTVVRGASTTVSWTSAGTSASQPCQLLYGSYVIATGNQGSKTIPTANAATGTLIFSLQCTAPAGAITKTATLLVQ